MNRRQFFGMSAVALAAAGLPAILLPEKKIFLPPTGGWFERPLVMREISQYDIVTDSFPVRYDAAWLDSLGEAKQFNICFRQPSQPYPNEDSLERCREIARGMLIDAREFHRLKSRRQIELKLPTGYEYARYV